MLASAHVGEDATGWVAKQEFVSAAADLLVVMRVAPTESGARWATSRTVAGLDEQGWTAHQRGNRSEAVRLLSLASTLSPFDGQLHKHQEEAVRAGITGTPQEVARLRAAAQAAPDDFSAHQALDYALAHHRNFAEVIAMWNEYLARHPDDANALFERSGAHFNSGHRAEAKADLERACELGVDQACAYLKLPL